MKATGEDLQTVSIHPNNIKTILCFIIENASSPFVAVVGCGGFTVFTTTFGRLASLVRGFSPSLSPLLQELVELRAGSPTAAEVAATTGTDLVITS